MAETVTLPLNEIMNQTTHTKNKVTKKAREKN